jgi:nitrate/nitrite transport system permease protein
MSKAAAATVSKEILATPPAGVRSPAVTRAKVQALWRAIGIPFIAFLVFLFLWGRIAANVETSLGQIPGPVAVWQQAQALWADHLAERAKAAAFYQREASREQQRRDDNPGVALSARK